MVGITQQGADIAFTEAPTDVAVDTSLSKALSAVGVVAGQIGQQVKARTKKKKEAETERAVTEIAEEKALIDRVTGLGGTFNERQPVDAAGLPLTLEGDAQATLARIQENGGRAFGRIQEARKQGVVTETAAKIEIENEVRRLMGESPGYAEEIRQLAASRTGFDPLGVRVKSLLDTATASKPVDTRSPLEKKVDGLVGVLNTAGTPVDKATISKIFGQQQLQEARASTADSDLKLEEIGFDEWLGTAATTFSPSLLTFGAGITSAVKKEGGVNAAQTTAFISSEKVKAVAALQLQATKTGRRLLPQDLEKIRTTVDSLYQPVQTLTADSDKAALIGSNLEELAAFQRLLGANALPELTFWTNNFGAPQAIRIMEMFKGVTSKFLQRQIENSIPGIGDLARGRDLSSVATPQSFYNTFKRVVQGQGLSPEALELLPGIERVVIDRAAPEVREIYGEGITQQGLPERAFDIINSKKVVPSLTEVEKARARRQYRTFGPVVDRLAEDIAARSTERSPTNIAFQGGKFVMTQFSIKQGSAFPIANKQVRHLNQLLRGFDTGLASVAGVRKEDFIADVTKRLNKQRDINQERDTNKASGQILRFETDTTTGELVEVENAN